MLLSVFNRKESRKNNRGYAQYCAHASRAATDSGKVRDCDGGALLWAILAMHMLSVVVACSQHCNLPLVILLCASNAYKKMDYPLFVCRMRSKTCWNLETQVTRFRNHAILPQLLVDIANLENRSGEFRLRNPLYSDLGEYRGGFLMGKIFSPKMIFFDVSEGYNFLDFFHQIFFSWWFLFDCNKTILKQEQKIHKIDKMMPVIAKISRLRRAK